MEKNFPSYFGLFNYATKQASGFADFDYFSISVNIPGKQ